MLWKNSERINFSPLVCCVKDWLGPVAADFKSEKHGIPQVPELH